MAKFEKFGLLTKQLAPKISIWPPKYWRIFGFLYLLSSKIVLFISKRGGNSLKIWYKFDWESIWPPSSLLVLSIWPPVISDGDNPENTYQTENKHKIFGCEKNILKFQIQFTVSGINKLCLWITAFSLEYLKSYCVTCQRFKISSRHEMSTGE